MGRWLTAGVLAGLTLLVASCSGGEPTPNGVLSISVDFVAPAPGRPMSIGGYAAFGSVTGPGGDRLFDGELSHEAQLIELPSGDYNLEVSTRPASDAIEIDQNGNVRRDFGPVSATCSATVRILPPSVTAVRVTLVGGDSCSIGSSE